MISAYRRVFILFSTYLFFSFDALAVNNIVRLSKANAQDYVIDGGPGGVNRQNIFMLTNDSSAISQQWIEINRDDGYFSYQKVGSDYCIDGGGGGANDQNVYLWQCNPVTKNQQWKKVDMGNGAYQLIKRNALGYALNGGRGGADGQNIGLWNSSSSSANLHWIITVQATPVVQMLKRNALNFAIDGNHGATQGQDVYLYSEDKTNENQQWYEINQRDGYYRYQKVDSEFCLDGGDGGENKQNVYLGACHDNSENQQWKKVDAGDGYYRLEKRNALGFSIDGNKNGHNNQSIYLWTSSYSNQNQQWYFNYIDISEDNPDKSDWDVYDYSEYSTGHLYGTEYPEQIDFNNYPEHSWDTVPLWLIVRNSSAYSDADIESFAEKFDLIVWEKANKAGFSSIEKGILDSASRVRAINKDVKNIFYWNTQVHYTGYETDAAYQKNAYAWSEHEIDDNGNEITWMFKDLYYWHNWQVEGMRDWWINAIADITSYDQIDGIMVDKVVDKIMVSSAYNSNGEPRTDYLLMLDDAGKALPSGKLYLGNSLRNEREYAGRPYMEFMDGSYLERWNMFSRNISPNQGVPEAVAVSLQLMREALKKGKIILFKTEPDGTTQAEMKEELTWNLALFLIIAEKNAYFAYQGSVNARDDDYIWNTPTWMNDLNRPLGKPLGAPIRDGFIYTRSYEYVDVWVNVEIEEATLTWK